MWLMGTVTALVLLFGYHTSTSSTAATAQGANASNAAPPWASSSTSTSGSTAATTMTGTVTQTRFGPVQVELSVANGEITAVQVLQYPNETSKDEQINAHAIPILIQETLKAQSAKIDMVSGATYTSAGYETSLQSALDKAGL